jgi:hypothetical protein
MRLGDLRLLVRRRTVRPHRQKRRPHDENERSQADLLLGFQNLVTPHPANGLAGGCCTLNATLLQLR